MKVLVAHRGEIARRIIRAVDRLGWTSVALYTADEADAPFVTEASEARLLPGRGAAAYLDVEAVVQAAVDARADLLHPGYGFLSEEPRLPDALAAAGVGFVGPEPQLLALFGDKGRAREHAVDVGVPVLAATASPTSLEDAAAFLTAQGGPVMIKATSGGGGRGMRVVRSVDELDEAWRRSTSEARGATGRADVYLEELMAPAKHLEVQVVSDGTDTVTLGERECSVQRRHQKLVEHAPSPSLNPQTRQAYLDAAERIIDGIGYRGLATVEFLADADDPARFAFIEVNPRLQVEHTVTEEITGVDLVVTQLRLAAGESLEQIGVRSSGAATPAHIAIQLRLNAEHTTADGRTYATAGTVTTFTPPEGARVDTAVARGSVVDTSFDSLLAKIITRTPADAGFAAAAEAARTALTGLELEGVETNRSALDRLLAEPTFTSGTATTTWLDDHPELLASAEPASTDDEADGVVRAAFAGTVVAVERQAGEPVGPRGTVLVLESMKMEHPVSAGVAGHVESVEVSVGDQVGVGDILARIRPSDVDHDVDDDSSTVQSLDHVREDLAEVLQRHEHTVDEARPTAVARRHSTGHRMARENIRALVEPDTFTEYGALTVAAQRSRRSLDDLIVNTPADGIVTGIGQVNATADRLSECAILAYDYTVLAGTQGYFNHQKTDRLLRLAYERELPVVFFAEGGGGRPGDVDTHHVVASGLGVSTFSLMGRLSGHVPTVGVVTGRCFAGNAAIVGCCDVVIATRDSTIGMAGPAMIEGGGLGRFAPEEVGPMDVQTANGVVDVLVEDDEEAVAVARRYLSYFQGPRKDWSAADQRRLRQLIPENRMRVYDVRQVIHTLADDDSVLELRAGFGAGAITALVRIEGRPMGLIANNPAHLGGAIDADSADKMARFLQLCDAHDLPVVALCDTPGFMVGPEAERTATVRHFSRLFVIGAHLSIPLVTVVLRKAYGLGAQAMAAGGFRQTTATVAWPTGEVGPMGLEGAVQLGYAKELAEITDPAARQRRFDELVAQHYEQGKATNAAMVFELDDVIDPAETRRWIDAAFAGNPRQRSSGRSYVDTW